MTVAGHVLGYPAGATPPVVALVGTVVGEAAVGVACVAGVGAALWASGELRSRRQRRVVGPQLANAGLTEVRHRRRRIRPLSAWVTRSWVGRRSHRDVEVAFASIYRGRYLGSRHVVVVSTPVAGAPDGGVGILPGTGRSRWGPVPGSRQVANGPLSPRTELGPPTWVAPLVALGEQGWLQGVDGQPLGVLAVPPNLQLVADHFAPDLVDRVVRLADAVALAPGPSELQVRPSEGRTPPGPVA